MVVERGDILFSYLRLFVVSTLAGPRYVNKKSAGFTTVHMDHATSGLVSHCARLKYLPAVCFRVPLIKYVDSSKCLVWTHSTVEVHYDFPEDGYLRSSIRHLKQILSGRGGVGWESYPMNSHMACV